MPMANQTDLKHPETLEESPSSLILCACESARNLESNLPNLIDQPDKLSMSIDDIVKTFIDAKKRLLFSQNQTPSSSSFPRTQQPQIDPTATSLMEEWIIRSNGNCAQPADQLVQVQQLQAPLMKASPSRLRRSSRKNESEKTLLLPAPQFGNMEVPPEDGFTWRKYGQKDIFGSKHPRSYYRCTHKKLYECPAKKQVQRLDHNPNIFCITYRGNHTCIISSTAPSLSSIPPPQLPLADVTTQSATSASVSRWLLSTLSLHGGAATGPGCTDASSAGAGPSTSIYGSGTDYMVADLAVAMFNSESSRGNSAMESLFPFTEDKWELGDKKSRTL